MQRRWANLSLVALVALMVVALLFRQTVWGPYLLGLSLAGLAGGIADWYAVTALFRHPLGIKWLPHTSIIAANRDRIINAIAQLVETELLSQEFLNRHIQKIEVSQALMRWMEKPLSSDVSVFLSHTLRDWASQLPEEKLAGYLKRFAEEKAEDIVLADWLERLVEWLIRSGNDRQVFDFLRRQVETGLDQVEFTEDMERRLKEMIEHYTKTGTQKFFLGLLESFGTVDYHELSVSVKEALTRWLNSDKAFEQFEMILVRIMRALRDDAVVRSRVEEAKRSLLGQVPWERLVRYGKDKISEILESGQGSRALEQAKQSVHDWLEREPGNQAQIDALVKGLLMSTVTRYHSMIGKLVKDNLEAMDEREWIDKLEFYVGRDLQWIRVNGAIVGALVGLLITVLTHL
ncbi:DUF445 domain-containing protein [Sulfobacillus harzensis]|uniref:DUF445 domain-containing protein n=1 Tax=Sulfobacillus harzensis TaxID=2729629 RepID=A0A7Y0L4N0_9FIRM|nr:DUF445 domain-containing protein [Sulfobacillus harzensis]NMP22320.1 DUF445 domain-containing protein [Sulfobacillus harzensis]